MQQPIRINVTAEEVKAVFFKDNAYDFFRSPPARQMWTRLAWVAGVAGALILALLALPNTGPYIGFVVAMLAGQTVMLIVTLRSVYKHRRHVVLFAKSVAANCPADLRVTDLGFSFTFKGAERIERWTNVVGATVAEDHISLQARDQYFFPKAGMPEESFVWLSKVVRERTYLGQEASGDKTDPVPIGFKRSEGAD